MELEEFLRNPPVDNGLDSVCIGGVYAGDYYCYGRGWGYGYGCGADTGYTCFFDSGLGKCIELINGSGFGAGYGDGCGTIDGSGR